MSDGIRNWGRDPDSFVLISPPVDSNAHSDLRTTTFALETDLKRSDIIDIPDVPISGEKNKVRV